MIRQIPGSPCQAQRRSAQQPARHRVVSATWNPNPDILDRRDSATCRLRGRMSHARITRQRVLRSVGGGGGKRQIRGAPGRVGGRTRTARSNLSARTPTCACVRVHVSTSTLTHTSKPQPLSSSALTHTSKPQPLSSSGRVESVRGSSETQATGMHVRDESQTPPPTRGMRWLGAAPCAPGPGICPTRAA